MVTCKWRDEDDDGNLIDEECGAPALWYSCKPTMSTPTCAAHKCRCAYTIRSTVGAPPSPIPALRDAVCDTARQFSFGQATYADLLVALRAHDFGVPSPIPALRDAVVEAMREMHAYGELTGCRRASIAMAALLAAESAALPGETPDEFRQRYERDLKENEAELGAASKAWDGATGDGLRPTPAPAGGKEK